VTRVPEVTGRAPLWLERGLIVVAAAIASFGGAGLILAILGHYSLGLVAPFGIAGTVAAVAVALRFGRAEVSSRSEHAAAALMCAIALGTVLWNASHAGAHSLTDRDGGSYAVTAQWISAHGSLEVHSDPTWRASDLALSTQAQAMYELPDGTLQFQFSHLVPVLLAEAQDLGGTRLLYQVPALLSGLAVLAIYAVGRRVVRQPWVLAAMTTALAISLPQLYIARDTLSETCSQVLLWVGLLALLCAFDRTTTHGTRALTVTAGLFVGATFTTRIDAPAYVILLPLLAALAWLATPSAGRRTLLRRLGLFVAGAVPPIVLGTVDLRYRSGGYYDDLRGEVYSLYAAIAGVAVLSLLLVRVWPHLGRMQAWTVRRQARLATVAGVAVVAGLLIAWLVRPYAMTQRSSLPIPLVGDLESREGLAVDPTRTFGEQTMVWFGWYLGPVLLGFAVLGAGLLVHRVIRRPSLPGVLLLAVTGMLTVIYLWDPKITPDQLWATRRFAPVSFPLTVILAGVGITGFARWVHGRVPSAKQAVVAAVASIAALVPVGIATAPLRQMSPLEHQLRGVQRVCAAIGADAAVLFPATAQGGAEYPAALASWCSIPAASMKDAQPLVAQDVRRLAEQWQAQGRTLWLVARDPKALAALPTARPPAELADAVGTHDAQQTISRRPVHYDTSEVKLYGAPVLP